MFAAKMVRPSGFEPLAFRLGGGRSILLSYGRIWNFWCHWRTNYAHLGGGCPIQLSYGAYEIAGLKSNRKPFPLPLSGKPDGCPAIRLFIIPDFPACVNASSAMSLFRKVLLGYNFGGFHKSTLKQQESCAIIGSTNRNLRSC